MAWSLTDRSIRSVSLLCRTAFEDCQSVEILKIGDWAEDRLADFNLWARGSGAVAIERFSLDKRLEQAQVFHSHPSEEAEDLVIDLLEARDHDLNSVSETPEAATCTDNKLSVENIAKQLFRLTAAIRKSGTQARLNRADHHFDQLRHEELQQELTTILLGGCTSSSYKEATAPCLGLISDLDSHGSYRAIRSDQTTLTLTGVQKRLIRANLIRRGRFIYQQRHQKILATERKSSLVPHSRKPDKEKDAVENTADGIVRRPESSISLSQAPPQVREPESMPSTEPTAVSLNIKIPEGTQKSMTIVSRISARADYPQAPISQIKQGQSLFKCPSCCQELPVSYSKGTLWRKHLTTDLTPYTCVLEDCPKPSKLYLTSEEWRRHMAKEHTLSQYWVCIPCSEEETAYNFTDEEEFHNHLATQHSDTITGDQIEMFSSVCLRTTAPQLESCPLCATDSHTDLDPKRLLDHIAQHVHAFSLYSLPWPKPGRKEAEFLQYGRRDLGPDDDYFDRPDNPYFDEASDAASGRASLDGESDEISDNRHASESDQTPIVEEASNRTTTSDQPSAEDDSDYDWEDDAQRARATDLPMHHQPHRLDDIVEEEEEEGEGKERAKVDEPSAQSHSELTVDNLISHDQDQPLSPVIGWDEFGSVMGYGQDPSEPTKIAEQQNDRRLGQFFDETSSYDSVPGVRVPSPIRASSPSESGDKVEAHSPDAATKKTFSDIWRDTFDEILEQHELAQLLEDAIKNKNVAQVQGALDRGANVNMPIEKHGNALQAALYQGNTEVVRLLLSNGADINAQGGKYGRALQAASYQGDKDIVELLLDHGADVNAQGGEYGSALQAASYQGNKDLVELLLLVGADINAQGGEYGCALQAASLTDDTQLVAVLLRYGADVNTQSGKYGSALQAASYRGSRKVVQLLLDNGADINAQGGEYGSALQAASVIQSSHIVQYLLGRGANINAQGGKYGNALQAASFTGNTHLVSVLLDRGANVNAQGGEYGNALQAASYKGHEDVVRLLLDKGADINAQGGEYGSALQAAATRTGNVSVVRTLLERGADTTAYGGKYGNALLAATAGGDEEISNILESRLAQLAAIAAGVKNAKLPSQTDPVKKANSSSSPYPWSWRDLILTDTTAVRATQASQSSRLSPFPRYGAATNATSSKDGSIFLMGGLTDGQQTHGDLWRIELTNDKFACHSLMTEGVAPSPRVGHAACSVGNAFIIFGGDNKKNETDELDDTLYLLNTDSRHWSGVRKRDSWITARFGLTMTLVGTKLYVFGGQDDGHFFRDLVAFDLSRIQDPGLRWDILTPDQPDSQDNKVSPQARTNHTAVAYRGKLYIFGGTDGVDWYNDVWCYDPRQLEWTSMNCHGYIPEPREGHAAALVNDVMYIFGGRRKSGDDISGLAALSLEKLRWFTFQNMGPTPSPRSGHGMTAHGTKIFVTGGEPGLAQRDSEELSRVYILDTSKIRYPSDG